VIDAVAELELGVFYAAYRAAGHGRAAHDPAMMVALLLYSYAIGERSLRRIERRCLEDVATRVICANQAPDHTTIARFRQRHETALAGLFGEVLALCAEAGLVEVGVVAVDATKVHANASQHATRGYERIAAEILKEADAADAAEDERFGERRGDQLPAEQLSMGEQQALVDQWQAFAEGLAAVPGPRWISPPSAIKASEDKAKQLTIARQVGFAVPHTVWTNDVAEARAMATAALAVIKTFGSVGPVAIGGDMDEAFSSPALQPVDHGGCEPAKGIGCGRPSGESFGAERAHRASTRRT